MTNPLHRLARQFAHFVGGGTLGLLLSLITFPILTRLLSRDDYGMLGLVVNTVSFAVVLAKAGLSDGIIRFYREYAGSPERLTVFTSTIIVRGTAFALAACAAYTLLVPYILPWLGIDARYLACFYVMAPYLLVRPANIVVMNVLRARGLTLRYNAVNIIGKALSIGLGFFLLMVVIGQLYGYILGTAIAEICAFAALLWWYFGNYGFHPSRTSGALALKLIHFGLPLLLTELAYLLLNAVDRYLIVAFYGEGTLGLYSVGYNVPSYINELLMFSLSYAIVPIFTNLYVTEGRERTEEFLSSALRYYLVGVIPLCVGYYAVSTDMIVTLASTKYADAASFSPIVLVARVILGVNSIIGAGLYLEKKTLQTLAIMLTVVAINVVANLLMLPHYQVAGAAYALLVACVASCALTAVLSFRYIRVRVDLRSVAFYAAVSALMYFAVAPIETGSAWVNLLCKTAVGTLIVTAAVLAKEPEARRLLRWRAGGASPR